MRIESLEIKNFKVLRHLELADIPNLVVIAGPNGSGKTALFDALRVFKEAIATYSVRYEGPTFSQQLLQQVGPVITIGQSEASITVSIKLTDAERRIIELPDDHGDVLTGTVVVDREGAKQQETARLISSHDIGPGYLKELLGRYRSGVEFGVIDHIGPDRRFSATQVTNISFSAENEEQELQRLVFNSPEKFSTLTQDLVMMRFLDMQEHEDGVDDPHEYISGVREIFKHFLPDEEFVDVRIPPNFSGLPQILVRSSGVEHDINQLSSGQREILMTYTHLEKLRPTASIVLFDEPELHLHPTLQRRVIGHLRRLIDRGSNQIWVITQAEEIVDTTEYESLFAMTRKGDPAIFRVKQRAERIDLLRHLGATVGLQLTSPRILFVEGDSDAELLQRLYGTLPAEVSVVSTEGKSNLMRLTPAAMSLLDDTIDEGQFYFVRDRDVDDDSKAIDELEEKNRGYFFTWDRYHIENYLLDAEAIYRVLEGDPDLPNSFMSAIEVREHLRSIAESTKEYILARYLEAALNPALRRRLVLNPPEGVKDSLLKAAASRLERTRKLLDPAAVDGLYEETRLELETRWDSEWDKLCIGRDVLQRFHKNHVEGLDYEVFRNKVARKMRDLGRIPKTITVVMSAVTADVSTGAEVR